MLAASWILWIALSRRMMVDFHCLYSIGYLLLSLSNTKLDLVRQSVIGTMFEVRFS